MESGTEIQEKEPRNFSSSPDFRWLCDELFVKIDNIINDQSKTNNKTKTTRYLEVIQHFIKLWRLTVGNDIYPALRLILPYRDNLTFNIKEVVLIKAICSYLHLPKNSITEKRLLRWKENATRSEKLSDFCVQEIRKRRGETKADNEHTNQRGAKRITIDELNSKLEELANDRSHKGKGYSSLAESHIFRYLMDHMSIVELKHLFDILLRSKVIGGLEHKFLYCWHPDARDYLSVVSDLRLVTQKLWDPNVRLGHEDLSIQMGYVFSPQLSKRATTSYGTICKNLKNDFFIEEKMDGERIQVHYMDYGNSIKFFSRRGTDYTYLYGATKSSETISKYLRLDPAVRNCILDGEVVTYDSERDVVLPFGIVKGSAKDALTTGHILGTGFSPMLVVFDLLVLNNVTLTENALHQRKDYLSKILNPVRHHIEIINSRRSNNEEDIKASLATAIELGSEGVILKRSQSKYLLGERNNSWIKIKPEYLEEFGENMDLLVMGRDRGKKDSYLCGLVTTKAKEEEEDNNELPNSSENSNHTTTDGGNRMSLVCVRSFCYIANGLSLEDVKEINAKTRGSWISTEEQSPPRDILKFGSKLPIEWIHPQQSIVLEVKARSLDNTESSGNKYNVGCTVFGGYCRQIRFDKDWRSCYSMKEFQQDRKRKKNPGKQTFLKIAKKSVTRRTKNYGLLDLGPKLLEKNFISSKLFSGLHFYVLSDFSDQYSRKIITKESIMDVVMKNGGTIVHNVVARNFQLSSLRIIGDRMTRECILLIKRGYDILSPEWIYDCVENQKVVQIETDHCFKVSEELLFLAQHRTDVYGDSYTLPTNSDLIDRILTSNRHVTLPRPIEEMGCEEVYTLPHFLFMTRIMYVAPYLKDNPSVVDICNKIKLFGGKVTEELQNCNLVVIADSSSAEMEITIREIRHQLSLRVQTQHHAPLIPHIVTSNWIDDSIKANSQVPEEDYQLMIVKTHFLNSIE